MPATTVAMNAPAPVGGINALAPISSIPASDCVSLINMTAEQYGLRSRGGWKRHCTGFESRVGTAMQFQVGAVAGVNKLFGVTKNGIFDCTSPRVGPYIPAVPVNEIALSGATGAEICHFTQYVTKADSWLLACSETDGYFNYETTGGWVKVIMGGGGVTGVDPANFVFPMVWKNRAWFIERETSSAWYLPPNSVIGAAQEFDFGANFRHGGFLRMLLNWTHDAGNGLDDHLVAISSAGDVVIYQGTDPSQAASFRIVGTWYIGAVPKGRRFATEIGGDPKIVCGRGLIALSEVLQAEDKSVMFEKINPAISNDVSNAWLFEGWQTFYYPRDDLFLLNRPGELNANGKYTQWVQGIDTKGWSRFDGVDAFHFTSFLDVMYFGGRRTDSAGVTDHIIGIAQSGNLDDVESGGGGGNTFESYIQFSFMPHPEGKRFRFVGVRPIILSSETVTMLYQLNPEFRTDARSGSASAPVIPSGAKWNAPTSKWNASGIVWGGRRVGIGAYETLNDWLGGEGEGHLVSLTLKMSASAPYLLTGATYLIDAGGLF